VQNRFSPAVRESEPQLRLCEELGLAFLPWSPLGGVSRSSLDEAGTKVARSPFHVVADGRGVSPQSVALAWHLAQSPVVIPIPGATRPDSIRDSAWAPELRLTEEELSQLP
jgi:aryl-alcohol dehydrogenase-like predicted oxidoreductase